MKNISWWCTPSQDTQLYYNSQFGAYFYYDVEEAQYKLYSLAESTGTEGEDHMMMTVV